MLPSEGGSSSESSSEGPLWPFDVFESATDAVADVVTELSSFQKFQQRVDELIRDLKGSAAGSKKLGEEPLSRHQFGGGDGAWVEASGLFASYHSVISELETLSKLLSDSIEGMGIAVMASHEGYHKIDTDLRDRMAAISAEATEHYGGSYDPDHAKHTSAQGGSGTGGGSGDDTGTGTDRSGRSGQAPAGGGNSGGQI
ncbi:hypothetical protein ACWCP6_15775 [Streptomyces sp. NPDC002004]